MPHDVFISYASGDKSVADSLCATLESNNIRCWIAPRDVFAGSAYGESIIDAIHDCRIMILVFSAKANASQHIPKEIERAVSSGATVIPVRIEDVMPGKSLDYFIGNVHWHDAFPPPLERHFESLAKNVKVRLSRASPLIEPRVERPVPAPTPPVAVAPRKPDAATASKQAASPGWKAAVGVLSALVVFLVALFLWRTITHSKIAELRSPTVLLPADNKPASPGPETVTPPTGRSEVTVAPTEKGAPSTGASEPKADAPSKTASTSGTGEPTTVVPPKSTPSPDPSELKVAAPPTSRQPPDPTTNAPRAVMSAPEFVLQNAFSAISNTRSMAFSPDGRLLLSGGYDNSVRLWNAATGQQLKSFSGHSRSVSSVVFSADGRRVASGSLDKTIKIWDVSLGRERRTLSGHSGVVQAVAFSPDGRLVASGSQDKTVKIWDVSSGSELRTLSGHSSQVQAVAFSPDGRLVASGSQDKTIKIWDAATAREIRTLSGHSGIVEAVSFSPDGRWIASGSSDKTIKIWEVATGRQVRTLSGHSGVVEAVTFSPEGRWIASGSLDQTIKIWDAATGKEMRTLSAQATVTSIALSPDGRSLASSGSDWRIKIWARTSN